MIAGIELGGTKTVVAIGSDAEPLQEQYRFPTTDPDSTLRTAAEWILARGPVEALGIASFGPVGINPDSPRYGTMLDTPKEGWSNFDLLALLSTLLPGVALTLETDVNAALLAEAQSGAAKDCPHAAYITIGTGIGAGLLVDGRIVHGALHPEFGHLRIPVDPNDTYPGACPYHGQCLEGLASGPAIAARWGRPAHEIPPEDPAWDLEANYLAHGVLAFLAIASPTRVIIGGGVSQAANFHSKVERHLRDLANGYFSTLEENHPYVVPPALHQDAGIKGALLIALLSRP